MKLIACGKTDTGVQRSNNEDSFYLAEQLGLFIVADGMGGHAAGEIASQMAIDSVRKKIEPRLEEQASVDDLLPVLTEAVISANLSIATAATENPNWSGMGTTLTILLLHAGQALLTHVGDSRLYRWRNKKLEQLSDDHTLVADQLRRGIISAAEAKQSNLRNLLLQAVGTTEQLDICQKTQTIEQGDCFLLCSDGLSDPLTQEQISQILTTNPDPKKGCEQLIAQTLIAGGKDNITAILVTVDNK